MIGQDLTPPDDPRDLYRLLSSIGDPPRHTGEPETDAATLLKRFQEWKYWLETNLVDALVAIAKIKDTMDKSPRS